MDAATLTDPVVGSVLGLAAASGGNLMKQYSLSPWGILSPDTGVVTRHLMAGREYDAATGLYYMRARYYDPQLGRFLSEDPAGVRAGLNLYRYSGNDPVDNRDPSGLDVICYGWFIYATYTDTSGTVVNTPPKFDGLAGCTGFSTLPSDESRPGTVLPLGGKATTTGAVNARVLAAPETRSLTDALYEGFVDLLPDAVIPLGKCIDRWTNGSVQRLAVAAGFSLVAEGTNESLGSALAEQQLKRTVTRVLEHLPWLGTLSKGVSAGLVLTVGAIGAYDLGIEAQCALGLLH